MPRPLKIAGFAAALAAGLLAAPERTTWASPPGAERVQEPLTADARSPERTGSALVPQALERTGTAALAKAPEPERAPPRRSRTVRAPADECTAQSWPYVGPSCSPEAGVQGTRKARVAAPAASSASPDMPRF